MKVLVPEDSETLSISRDVEPDTPGPLQLHEPPEIPTCGPRFTELPGETVALFVICQGPLFTSV
jgi:hypothetical protein